MKIVSRFTDAYDYGQSIDRNDDVIYHREYKHGEVDNVFNRKRRKPLQEVPEGLYLKVGCKLRFVSTGRINLPAANEVAHLQDYDYCADTKKSEKIVNRELMYNSFSGFFDVCTSFGITYMNHTNVCEFSGKVFVNKKMAAFILLAEGKQVDEPKVLEYLTGEVGLMVVRGYDIVKYVNDFSLQASGLYEAYQAQFEDNIAALVDMSLSTKEEVGEFVISDKEQLTRKGFDNMISFRHRKGEK